MSSTTWTLLDTSRRIHESPLTLRAADGVAPGNWSITQRTLQGGLSDGIDLIEIDNGRMQIYVLPTRGLGIWRATLGSEQTLGWRSPVRGPVHPKYVPLTEPSGLGWLEGFDEFVVRCGLESNGAPDFDASGKLTYPLHGRIANRPAHYVEVTVDESAGTISLRGIVEETRFHFQKLRLSAALTTAFDSTSFTIADEVQNFGGTQAQMQMLYHINIGEPLLVPGSQFVAPVQEIKTLTAEPPPPGWEVMGPARAGSPEECYLMRLQADEANRTRVLLKNEESAAGTVLSFNTVELPCFTLWKNMVDRADGYVAGIEPGTNFPHKRSSETTAGRVISLAPQQTWKATVTVDWLTTAHEVASAEQAIQNLG